MQVWLKDNQEFWDLTKSEYAVMVQCWRASIYYPELVDENLPGNKVTAELSGIYIPGEIHKSYSSTWMDVDKQLMGDEDFGGRIKTMAGQFAVKERQQGVGL